ncbi:MAG: DUF5654 family protein [archaeon]
MKKDLIEKLATLVIAAFGLVAALAWNETVKAFFKIIFGEINNVIAMLIYAIFVTILAVIITVQIGKFASNKKS